MGILMTGIDHGAAPIDIRTIFSFTKKDMADALGILKGQKGILGCVMISTCNRMELYLSTNEDFSDSIFDLLCEIREVDAEKYRQYFNILEGRKAVRHLFRLSAGLESRILGDDQIITQVKDALSFARDCYATDHVLETLFRQAVTGAKKVKTTNNLLPADQSVVKTAIRTLKEDGYSFDGKTCLVIGNGVMGKLAANSLEKQGADVTVTVRQYRSGHVEIPEGCARIDYGRRMERFPFCDYVFSATVSPNYTLTKELAASKVEKPMVLVDLAVPRDIDPQIGELEGIRLFDVDDFREEAVSEAQKAAISEAEQLLNEQMQEFFDWYDCVDLIPQIQHIKELAGSDLEVRLTKQIRQLPISPDEKKELNAQIESAAERTINKMIFELKGCVTRSAFLELLDGMEKIYGEKNDG